MTDITELSDISYGFHERQKVDIFIPEKTKTNCGIILFIHGGGWCEGDKSCHHTDCRYFSGLGYICAAMNYRFVAEDISIFNELDDIASALKTIKKKCAEYGFDINKAILSGESAGGHLSLMYSYSRKDESFVTPVAACVYCPPVDCSAYDFLYGISNEFEDWKYDILSKCCGYKLTKETFLNEQEQTALKLISPENYVSAGCVPTAVFHGKNDELVPLDHIYKFIDSINADGIKNDLLIYENSGHTLKDDPETAVQAKNIISRYAEMYL